MNTSSNTFAYLCKKKQTLKDIFSAFLRPATLWGVICLLMLLSFFLLGTNSLLIGIYPRSEKGILGIFTAPFVHGSWSHLYSNLIPLFILGTILHTYYTKFANEASFIIYLLTGFWVWLGARQTWHIGASGVVYGLAFFLFWSGVFRFKKDKIATQIAFFVTFFYIGMLEGIFPGLKGISWESHLFGGIAGTVVAFFYRNSHLPPPNYEWEKQPENPNETGTWDYKNQSPPPPEGFEYL